MGSRGRMLFDLNELPEEVEEAATLPQEAATVVPQEAAAVISQEAAVVVSQPQKSLPVPTTCPSNLFQPGEGSQAQGILNNNAFKHAPCGSGFQPFVRNKDSHDTKERIKVEVDLNSSVASTSMVANHISDNVAPKAEPCNQVSQAVEREEGEWSDADGVSDTEGSSFSNKEESAGTATTHVKKESQEIKSGDVIKDEIAAESSDTEMADVSKDPVVCDSTGPESVKNSEFKGNLPGDDLDSCNKSKDVKGVEATYALKFASNPAKRPKLDEHKEAMLGKKRARKTVFINVADAKQAGTMKTSTPRRQSSFPAPIVTRTVKEASRGFGEKAAEKQSQQAIRDQRQSEMMGSERSNSADPSDQRAESNGDAELGPQGRSKKMNAEEPSSDGYQQSVQRQASLKQSVDLKQLKGRPVSSQRAVVGQNTVDQKLANKRSIISKKQTSVNNTQYQDSSVERLIREVTSDKFWHNPEEAELQCVPGSFESAEEYIRVFEPLLFEECRAQLYSTYEEGLEAVGRDAHVAVRVKTVDRRERGWYDVVVLPMHEYKWNFKEGDVSILSFPRPGSAAQSGRSSRTVGSNEDADSECGRFVGTVRRHMPIDTRDPIGAIIHFYVGDSFDFNSEANVLRKLQPRSTWYLTGLGSLATTQREYVALHAFRRLNVQMQNAILQPSPEHFPKYEEQPPAMPDCFTPNFADHLHRSFNGPQLSAIHWAATHTAAGTSNGVKKQEPWPFTLVQGPPGTGKTHTVWGMLNVIHLVQYQHYYAALLKKLAPESYKQVSGSASTSSETVAAGSIDELLQSMDQNLFRTLPKLCPKPRMLVCAPSNAATDELLARVLDRGFIDGEMKVYRPDVARVGVDSQSRAAQAVSVERRTDQLLMKGRDEVIGWLHQLKCREQQLSQEIAYLQRELNMAAAVGRSQGSVGVDPDVLAQRDRNRDILLQKLAASVESRDKVLVEMSRLLILESRFRPGSNFNMEDARASLEASFANEAEIVFTTVSSSGRKLFSRLTHGFDMVVIDEAAQASEVGVLPPLSLGAARCVLVGDPQQLPATVISKAAGTLLYSRSLFERFQQAGCPTILLSVQYRMHPQIREFPSRYFYQGRLKDSESVIKLPDETYYRDALMAPYIFYDMSHGRESHRGGSSSYQNVHEAQFALRLYEHLQKFLRANGGKKASVGIITPYKLQLKCLQREFKEVMNTEEGKDIYINTVDAFQGQERDVIIMSCVRASNHGVGFVADIRRMNVALTRARRALWVVGNANALMQSEDWAALIEDAKARKCFMDLDSIPKDFLPMKVPTNTPGRNSSNNIRNMRTGGPRPRHLDMLPEPRAGMNMRVDEDERSNSVPRNGSYRNLDDFGRPGDRPRDNLQFGIPRRPNSSNGRREV